MAKSDKVVKRGVYLYLDGSEIKNDIQSVEKEMRALVSMQKKMVVGSEEYVRAGQKIRSLKGIIAEHNAQLRETEAQAKKSTFSFGKLTDGFNRFFGIIGAGVAALTGFTLAIRSLRDEKNKLEESQAGLKALTGLDDDSITWLTQQAKVLSTTMTKEGLRVRQSADEILDAFMLVGSAKPELLGDREALAAVTEEAMRLQAAAKDITLNEAVDALTLSLNQYGDAADQAARYTNVLAAGSQAGSANIASQAAAIRTCGTSAASANIPIEHTVGLIETLAYKGIKDEIAGTGLKRFFLTLQTGADATNPKIVGLDKALENLKNKNMGAGAIKKMFGEEGYNAASVIINNTEMVKQFTEAVTGTNVAVEQAATNSATAAAKLAQARNELKLAGIELADRLNPAITVSTNMATNLIKYLPGVLDWFKEWGSTILIVSGAFASYYTWLKAVTLYHTVLNGVVKLSTTIKVAHGVVMLMLEKRYRMAATVTTLYSKSMVANQTVTKAVMALQYLYAAALSLLHGRLKAAAVAMSLLNKTISLNPIVAVISLATLAAGAFLLLSKRTSLAKDAYKDFMRESQQARGELTKMYNSILSSNEGSQKRLDLIKEFNSKYGGYLSNLLSEKSTVQDIATAYNEATKAIQRKIAQEILDTKTSDIQSKAISDQADDLERVTDILSTRFTGSDVASRMQQIVAFTERNVIAGKGVDDIATAVGRALLKTKKMTVAEISDIQIAMKSYAKNVKETADQVSSVKKKLSPWLPEEKSTKPANELDEVVITPDNNKSGGTTGDENKKKKKERIEKELTAIESKYTLERLRLQNSYLEKGEFTQKEYAQFEQDLELQSLNDKLKVLGLEEKQRLQIQNKILEMKKQFNIDCINEDKKTAEKEKKQRDDAAKNELKLKERQEDEALLKLAESRIKENMTEQEYFSKFKDTRLKYLNEMLSITGISEDDRLRLLNEKRNVELEDLTKSNEREKELRSKQADLVLGIVDDFSDTISGLFDESTNTFKDYMREILLLSLNALEKIVDMTVVEVTIKSIKDGVLGLAAGAAKIAAIKVAFAAVKGLVGNFYTGGYTPSGAWNQPQGIVHSDEFISNRFAVRNPSLRPVFDLIDYAQRSGTVANLTGADVAAVLPSSGGAVKPQINSGSPVSNGGSEAYGAMMGMIVECTATMKSVKERFAKPIVTETYATGKRGTIEAEKLVERMENNVSRKR